jgi:hypothetical protein
MSGRSPSPQSAERFELSRIIGVETIDGLVHLSVQITYDPWGDADIYDHIHAINGLHQILIAAEVRANAERSAQYDDLRMPHIHDFVRDLDGQVTCFLCGAMDDDKE